ncbi:MAG: acyl-ACP--UDP-N-acetylglucosamine O-acyltransferase [Victivallales bacterium]|nr:acyl-ACP--UDP-N-acetylglucosamine O-acyltransferase [Victivallales bacterium]
MTKIDPRAVIADTAKIGTDVEIGPFAVIDGNVTIGDRCKIGPHAYLTGNTVIGENTQIHAGAIIGDAPQDLHYHGEPSNVQIGKDCIIREYVTIHRGTEEGSTTVVGDRVLLMAFSHLGHNCIIEDDVVIANATLLAGRVTVGAHAFISAGCMVHQFCRIGRLAMIGGGNAITQDVPPFCMLQFREVHGPNVVGLKRSGMADDARNALHQAIKIYFCFDLSRSDAVQRIREEVPLCPEVQEFIDFVMSTTRGICAGHKLQPLD